MLKKEIKDTKEKISIYKIQMNNYKTHYNLLTEINEKTCKKFDDILETDEEMIKELEKMDYLNEVVENNKKLIQELS